jgi:hypothetical protein
MYSDKKLFIQKKDQVTFSGYTKIFLSENPPVGVSAKTAQ